MKASSKDIMTKPKQNVVAKALEESKQPTIHNLTLKTT